MTDNKEALCDLLWAIFHISDSGLEYTEIIMDSINCDRIVELLNNCDEKIKIPSLRIIGNASFMTDELAEDFIQAGCLEPISKIFDTIKSNSTKMEACWVLSNISSGTTSQIQKLISKGILKKMCELIKSNTEDLVKKEALWTIANACIKGNDMQIWQMVKDGILDGLIIMLDIKNPELILKILEAVDNILNISEFGNYNAIAYKWQEMGGVDKMEKLQECKNKEVYDKANNVLDKYYVVEHEEEITISAHNN